MDGKRIFSESRVVNSEASERAQGFRQMGRMMLMYFLSKISFDIT